MPAMMIMDPEERYQSPLAWLRSIDDSFVGDVVSSS
jgi:hypothetical protein